MFCRYCGKPADDTSVYCKYCGKALRPCDAAPAAEEYDTRQTPDKASTGDCHGSPSDPSPGGRYVFRAPSPAAVKQRSAPAKSETMTAVFLVVLFIFAVAGLAIAGVAIAHLAAARAPTAPVSREWTGNEIAKLSGSVLTLYVYDENGDPLQTGSGFVVFDDSTLITNYHVIENGYDIEAVSEGDIHYHLAGAVTFDVDADIALLKFETATGLPVLPLADSAGVQVGDAIYAIGSPLGLKNTVSNGIVSAIRDDPDYPDLQITAPISGGSSGGVLLNTRGEAIGMTYASYEEGQNLNLAIPSAEFINLDRTGQAQLFGDIAQFYKPVGNSYSNYSAFDTRLAEDGDFVYQSYNGQSQIIRYNPKTGESTPLNMFGTNLSVYRGVLYFVSVKGDAICSYDLQTGEFCENLLLRDPFPEQGNYIYSLFVTAHGLSVYFMIPMNSTMVQLDFDGHVIGKVDKVPFYLTLADADYLVGCEPKNQELFVISLFDLSSTEIPIDFNPGALSSCGDDYLYLSDATKAGELNHLIQYDLITGEFSEMEKPDGTTYTSFISDDAIYYQSSQGTGKMSFQGTGYETICDFYPTSINFSKGGKLYAYGVRSIEDTHSRRYTEYFFRMNPDGTDLEILDKADVDINSLLS